MQSEPTPARSLAELVALAPKLAPRLVRRVSVEADACIPAVKRLLRGEPTQRSTRDRITRTLVALGIVAEGVDLTPPASASNHEPSAA